LPEAARILVVDDEDAYRGYLERFLRRRGYEVRGAPDGETALALAAAFRPALLLADWMLRDALHGLELARPRGRARPGLRVLLMTGFPASELRDALRRSRVDGCLEKPVGLPELAEAIAGALAAPPEPGAGGASSAARREPANGCA